MSQTPQHIDFGAYSEAIPERIPAAVQSATSKFWGLRRQRVAEVEDWESLRQTASELRLHTLTHLDGYLQQLEDKVRAAGGQVHWAADAARARQLVIEIAQAHGVKTAVKVKSMATEEIGLNAALEAAGITPYETDLGEFIIQLDGTGPSHIIVPAVHLKKEEIAELFTRKLGVAAPPDPTELTAIARRTLRQQFLQAEMGISGANFLVAETGTLVTVTNEGNGRMCTTLPDLHVAVVGIDKVVPDWACLSVFLRMLARSATGQKLSTYTSFITGPRQTAEEGGPQELHLILLDNGRTEILQHPLLRETLKCIRCGCCLNVCPVYKQVGGFAYGWFISGPVGAAFTTQMLGVEAAGELPFASTLCGACAEVCPVKVPLPEIMLELRRQVVEGPKAKRGRKVGAALGAWALRTPWAYRLGAAALPLMQRPWQRGRWLRRLPGPLGRWTKVRPLTAFQARFRTGRKSEEGQP